MEITDPTRRVILDAAIDRCVIRGTLTAPTGERRDFHGWLELSTALEAMLDPAADTRPNRLGISAAGGLASGGVPISWPAFRSDDLMGQRQGCVGSAGGRAWVGVMGRRGERVCGEPNPRSELRRTVPTPECRQTENEGRGCCP
jgi:hypothetical protein